MTVMDLYARMSVGLDGKEENIEDQLVDMEATARRMGVTVGERFTDGKSAWKRGVRRPGWERLIDRMKNGESDGVVIWHVDRLMRLPRDLETLLTIADDRQLKLASVHGEKDLSNPDDRFILRIEVAHACRSSDDTSRRSKRRNKGKRERGALLKGGRRPFGWPGKSATEEIVKRERAELVWAFEHVAGGGSLREVATRWNEAGLYGHSGVPWVPVTVRKALQRQRHAGRVEHEGEVVATIADHKPLIDPDLFDDVQAIFASRSRGGQFSTRSVGGGFLACSECGGRLVSQPRYRRDKTRVPAYKCCKPKGCGKVGIDQEPVDKALRALVVARLSDPRIAARVSAVARERNAEIEQLRAELATTEQAETAITTKFTSGGMSLEAFDAGHRVVRQRVERLQAALSAAEKAAGDVEQVNAASRLEVAHEWDEGDVERRRAMLKRAFRLHQVVVRPARQPGVKTLLPTEQRISVAPLSA